MTTRTDRRAGLLIGGLLALGFTAWAAFLIAGWSVGTAAHRDHRVLRGPIRELRVDASAADVSILQGKGSDVTVDGEITASLFTPRMRTEVSGSRLTVQGGCPSFAVGRCRATIVIHVPAATAVFVTTSSGDVQAGGLATPLRVDASSGDIDVNDIPAGSDLRTSSGDVSAAGLGGTVALESSSGDIDAVDLRAPSVSAHASSGDVGLQFAVAPQQVDVTADSGDVDVSVPPGAEAYRVDAETDSGDRHVAVRTDPLATRTLRAAASSGDVSVGYAR